MGFTPAALTRTRSWPTPGVGLSTSVYLSTSGPPVPVITIAFIGVSLLQIPESLTATGRRGWPGRPRRPGRRRFYSGCPHHGQGLHRWRLWWLRRRGADGGVRRPRQRGRPREWRR